MPPPLRFEDMRFLAEGVQQVTVASVRQMFAMRGRRVWWCVGIRKMLATCQDKASRPQSGRARIR